MGVISYLGQVYIPEDKCGITLIHKTDDMHTQLVVEEGILNQTGQATLQTKLAEFGGNKISYGHDQADSTLLNIGVVRTRLLSRDPEYLFKTQTWVLDKTRVNAVWAEIKTEEIDRNHHITFYSALGSTSLGVSETVVHIPNNRTLVALRNEDPKLFSKIYAQSQRITDPYNIATLLEEIQGPHWKTVEDLIKVLTRLEDRFKQYLGEDEDQRENQSLVDILLEKIVKQCQMKGIKNPNDKRNIEEALIQINMRAAEILTVEGIEGHYELWAYRANYTKFNVFAPPEIKIFAKWLAIYQLFKEDHITEKNLKANNCHTWAVEKAKAMGAPDIGKDFLSYLIAFPFVEFLTARANEIIITVDSEQFNADEAYRQQMTDLISRSARNLRWKAIAMKTMYAASFSPMFFCVDEMLPKIRIEVTPYPSNETVKARCEQLTRS